MQVVFVQVTTYVLIAGTVKFYYGYVKCMQTMSSIIMLATGMVYA